MCISVRFLPLKWYHKMFLFLFAHLIASFYWFTIIALNDAEKCFLKCVWQSIWFIEEFIFCLFGEFVPTKKNYFLHKLPTAVAVVELVVAKKKKKEKKSIQITFTMVLYVWLTRLYLCSAWLCQPCIVRFEWIDIAKSSDSHAWLTDTQRDRMRIAQTQRLKQKVVMMTRMAVQILQPHTFIKIQRFT